MQRFKSSLLCVFIEKVKRFVIHKTWDSQSWQLASLLHQLPHTNHWNHWLKQCFARCEEGIEDMNFTSCISVNIEVSCGVVFDNHEDPRGDRVLNSHNLNTTLQTSWTCCAHWFSTGFEPSTCWLIPKRSARGSHKFTTCFSSSTRRESEAAQIWPQADRRSWEELRGPDLHTLQCALCVSVCAQGNYLRGPPPNLTTCLLGWEVVRHAVRWGGTSQTFSRQMQPRCPSGLQWPAHLTSDRQDWRGGATAAGSTL